MKSKKRSRISASALRITRTKSPKRSKRRRIAFKLSRKKTSKELEITSCREFWEPNLLLKRKDC
jgi:hypothetical protein